jgi:hypothetical protein
MQMCNAAGAENRMTFRNASNSDTSRRQLQAMWTAQFIVALRQAREAGELPRAVDVNQLVFEITAMLFRANFAWIVTEDERVLDEARLGVKNVLAFAAHETRRGRQRQRSRKP